MQDFIHPLSDDFKNIYFIEGDRKGNYPFSHSLLIGNYLIDTGISGRHLKKLKKQFQINTVILSHWHEDHISGNNLLPNSNFICHINESTKLLPRIIGEGRAKQLMYLGTEINAEEAFNIGLVSQVCKREGLNRILRRTANSLVQKEHSALKWAKKLINEDQDDNFESVLAKELRVMMLAGQFEELKRRLEKFVKQ